MVDCSGALAGDRAFKPPKPFLGRCENGPPRPTSNGLISTNMLRTSIALGTHPHPKWPSSGKLAGLSCARILHDHGIDVQVFDKEEAQGPDVDPISPAAIQTGVSTTVRPAFLARTSAFCLSEKLGAAWCGLKHGMPHWMAVRRRAFQCGRQRMGSLCWPSQDVRLA